MAVLPSRIQVVHIMANRIMFDGENLALVPKTGAQMIAFYVDKYNSTEVSKMFPGLSQVGIQRSLTFNHNTRVFDVESGAISPVSDLETLITEFNEHSPYYERGGRPVIYCDRANIFTVRERTGKWMLGKNYYLWVATLDGTLVTSESLKLPENSVVACQNHAFGGYDSSVVYSGQWVP
jgi:hypothetical protein